MCHTKLFININLNKNRKNSILIILSFQFQFLFFNGNLLFTQNRINLQDRFFEFSHHFDRTKLFAIGHVTLDAGSAVTRDHSEELAEQDWVVSQLGSIDIDKRAVLVLHYYLDLPMPEVAEILDIPYGTAASRLHRGLEAMRTSMGVAPEAVPGLTTERSR